MISGRGFLGLPQKGISSSSRFCVCQSPVPFIISSRGWEKGGERAYPYLEILWRSPSSKCDQNLGLNPYTEHPVSISSRKTIRTVSILCLLRKLSQAIWFRRRPQGSQPVISSVYDTSRSSGHSIGVWQTVKSWAST